MGTYRALICNHCSILFKREESKLHKKRKTKNRFCSMVCSGLASRKTILVRCKLCSVNFEKRGDQVKKSPNHFCSHSCHATYQNTHKIKGIRRSKLEKWLEEKLRKLYPGIRFLFNKKSTIQSELDIFIPELKLAFEINGILHYRPIYGVNKLKQIQNNDTQKLQKCIEKGIYIHVVNVSKHTYVCDRSNEIFLKEIKSIIDATC